MKHPERKVNSLVTKALAVGKEAYGSDVRAVQLVLDCLMDKDHWDWLALCICNMALWKAEFSERLEGSAMDAKVDGAPAEVWRRRAKALHEALVLEPKRKRQPPALHPTRILEGWQEGGEA